MGRLLEDDGLGVRREEAAFDARPATGQPVGGAAHDSLDDIRLIY